eukprot:jgi/Astpho2/10005/fgenesh1_pg.00153_%23_22_t
MAPRAAGAPSSVLSVAASRATGAPASVLSARAAVASVAACGQASAPLVAAAAASGAAGGRWPGAGPARRLPWRLSNTPAAKQTEPKAAMLRTGRAWRQLQDSRDSSTAAAVDSSEPGLGLHGWLTIPDAAMFKLSLGRLLQPSHCWRSFAEHSKPLISSNNLMEGCSTMTVAVSGVLSCSGCGMSRQPAHSTRAKNKTDASRAHPEDPELRCACNHCWNSGLAVKLQAGS